MPTLVLEEQLACLRVGNQAGITKIVDENGETIFIKRIPGTDLTGINSVDFAPLTQQDSQAILSFLGIPLTYDGLDAGARKLITEFASLPHIPALAVLAVIGSRPELADPGLERILNFLEEMLEGGVSGQERRHALLALALVREVDLEAVVKVLDFYENNDNLFETFNVTQFFKYHANLIKSWEEATQIRERAARVDKLYTPEFLPALS